MIAEGQGPTAEQQMQLQRLMQSLKQIEEQQKELQAAIHNAKTERESMLKKDRDFYDPAAKEIPPPRMEVCELAHHPPAGTIESSFLAYSIHSVGFLKMAFSSSQTSTGTLFWLAGAER